MNYLILDDEPLALEDLEAALRQAAPGGILHGFSLPSEAMKFVEHTPVDVAFLDIELGSASGLSFAKQLKDRWPEAHIVFVTSHEQYAVSAFQIHATGYLLKPASAEQIRRELTFLYGEAAPQKQVGVRTFGGFEVLVDGKPLRFGRAKVKELLAYLVDRRGMSVSNSEACAVLWEDAAGGGSQKSYYRTIVTELRATLRAAGVEEILRRGYNSLAIVPERLDCDSYRFLSGDPQAVNSYRHDYLPNYSWAEFSVGALEQQF